MKFVYLLFALLSSDPALGLTESVLHSPAISISKDAPELTDLIGSHGSQLCAPISIAQAVGWLRAQDGRSLPQPTGPSQVRGLFKACGTDKEQGTHYHAAQACFGDALRAEGLTADVELVGAHATEVSKRHVITRGDLLDALKSGAAVVMTVGWYDYDAKKNEFKRVGGHFVNVYGYELSEGRFSLRIGNSLRTYASAAEAFDTVVASDDAHTTPIDAKLEIKGPGFEYSQATFVEDLIVAKLTRSAVFSASR